MQRVGGADNCSTLTSTTKAGVLIGTLTTEAHGVSGVLYVHDDVTLSIEQFYYDGYAPGELMDLLLCVVSVRLSHGRTPAAYPYFYTKGNQPSNTGGGIKM